jgi:hypothetical protein
MDDIIFITAYLLNRTRFNALRIDKRICICILHVTRNVPQTGRSSVLVDDEKNGEFFVCSRFTADV